MNQYHAQKVANFTLKPGDVTRKHWESIAKDAGLNARGLRLRVQELAGAIMNSKSAATETVGSLRCCDDRVDTCWCYRSNLAWCTGCYTIRPNNIPR